MIPAREPVQRRPDAKLLALDAQGRITHRPRRQFATLLRSGDLVVANDAATLPASLKGIHVRSGEAIEIRLARRGSLDRQDVRDFDAIVFGDGDYRTPTENRRAPPTLIAGDSLRLGPLRATVRHLLGHPRFAALRFEETPPRIWSGLATHGRPIQYAHMHAALELWDVWTPIAGAPAAFEPPSAGFALDWRLIAELHARGASFATLTHAAGISSTGDAALDRRLPLDEPYDIPRSTAEALAHVRKRNGRVVAIGTTVVRALEAAALNGWARAGTGVATQRVGPSTRLCVVDAILSGTHEPGTSHHALLGAFAGADALRRVDRALESRRYRTHEYGDSVFVERAASRQSRSRSPATTSTNSEMSNGLARCAW